MKTLRMEDNLMMDGPYDPLFNSAFTTDNTYNFDADSGIFDMSFVDLIANPEKFLGASLSSYPSPEFALDNNHLLNNSTYNTNSRFPDLQTLAGYQNPVTTVEHFPETCQLSLVAPSLANTQQTPTLSHPPSALRCPGLDDQPRRNSEGPIWSDAGYASSRSRADSEDVSANDEASQKAATQPRKKRGRKRANISDEERRNRKLERGRLAANKCRQKKRVQESELESKALKLLVERDEMLKINDDLRDEIMILQAQVRRHAGGECGGIPDAEQVISSVNMRLQRLEEAARSNGDQLKDFLGSQMYSCDKTSFPT